MSSREELEELAQACEECVGKDAASIDEHLESCPICQDYKIKAEQINQMMEVTQMMASKPEEERRAILSARMDQFSQMPDDKRKAAISDMLDAVGELSEEDRVKVVKTRTDLMVQLPKEKRDILMGNLQEIMSQWPDDRKMMEKRAIMAASQEYFILKRMLVRRLFKNMLE